MSRNSPSEHRHLRVLLQTFMPLTRYGLIGPLIVGLPSSTLITLGIFALAYGFLRAIIPQDSADVLALWGFVLECIGKSKLGKRLTSTGFSRREAPEARAEAQQSLAQGSCISSGRDDPSHPLSTEGSRDYRH